MFAMDHVWWEEYIEEVRRDFRGARYSVNAMDRVLGVTRIPLPFTSFGNSGAGAINMAALAGAKKIILLGYDCQHTDGQRHWHGNHPKGLGNADVVDKWPAQFERLAESLNNVEVVNCSRQTALDVFPRRKLAKVLC